MSAHPVKIGTLVGAIALLLVHVCTLAQPLSAEMLARINKIPDLKFPDDAREFFLPSPLAMALYKPPGSGPFPALVVMHTCGGLRQELWDWAGLAVDRGYVVFVVDSLGQRGVSSLQGCSPSTWVPPGRGAKDAFQALEHLRKFAFVDRDRVALVGFSWGAMVGLYVSSGAIASQFSSSRYGAVVGLYPICYWPGSMLNPPFEWLRPEIDKPLLVLMGAEDNEAPPAGCIPRLEKLAQKGVPVEWHVYPAATHCWDCRTLDNFSKTELLGPTIVYRYDRKITQDSAERMFAFLTKHLKADK